MKRILPLLLILLFISLAIAGCASTGGVAELPPQVRAADQMLASGHAREAAQSYAAQAAGASGALHDLLEMRAADAWQVAGNSAAARHAFADVDPKRLGGDDALRFRLVRAEFTIADGHAAQAVDDLGVADGAIPQSFAARWHRANANALNSSVPRMLPIARRFTRAMAVFMASSLMPMWIAPRIPARTGTVKSVTCFLPGRR